MDTVIHQLSIAENRLPYVVRSHFIKQYIPQGLGYGETFEQIMMVLLTAESAGLIQFDKIPHPDDQRPVKIVRLRKDNEMVKAILGSA